MAILHATVYLGTVDDILAVVWDNFFLLVLNRLLLFLFLIGGVLDPVLHLALIPSLHQDSTNDLTKLNLIKPLTLSLASPPCMLSDGGQGLLAKMSWK